MPKVNGKFRAKIYVCVPWEGDDDDYNHVKFTDLLNPAGLTPEECVGNVMDVFWGDDLHKAHVEGQGKKKLMKKLEAALIKEAMEKSKLQNEEDDDFGKTAKKRDAKRNPYGEDFVDPNLITNGKKKNCGKNLQSGQKPPKRIRIRESQQDVNREQVTEGVVAIFSNTNQIDPELMVSSDVGSVVSSRNAEADKDKKIYDLLKRVAYYEGVVRKSSKAKSIGPLAGLEDIGNGVQIEKSLLFATLVAYPGSPQLYLRSLVFNSGVFTLEEIANSSITGRRDPRAPEVQRPPLDPIKLNALKVHTIKTFKLTPEDREYYIMMGAIKNFPGDARARIRRADAKKKDSKRQELKVNKVTRREMTTSSDE